MSEHLLLLDAFNTIAMLARSELPAFSAWILHAMPCHLHIIEAFILAVANCYLQRSALQHVSLRCSVYCRHEHQPHLIMRLSTTDDVQTVSTWACLPAWMC